jgi:hypothetical protein
MDHFEKGLHAAIQQRTELWQSVADPAAEPPDIQALYPLEYAGKGEVGCCHLRFQLVRPLTTEDSRFQCRT